MRISSMKISTQFYIASAVSILMLSGCADMAFEQFRKRGEFLGNSSSLSFDSTFWKKDKKMRSQMSSILPYKLKGLKEAEVAEILGPPDMRSGLDPKKAEPECMVYEMQNKDGKVAMYLMVFISSGVVDKVELGLPK